MKYERPVRELLADCVVGLPQPFTKADVLGWFRSHYPDVAASTVNTHIAGLTAGSRPHQHLANYPPLLERVGHGLYRCIFQHSTAGCSDQRVATAPVLEVEPPVHVRSSQAPRVVLIGCVKSKRANPAPAKDLYTSALFAKRRRYAEISGVRWYIVSGKLGLVHPDEVIAPYELYLPKQPARYRTAWGASVAAQLATIETLAGLTVEIHAGDAYVNALRPPLEAAGAFVIDAVDATSFGAMLAWYSRPAPKPIATSASPKPNPGPANATRIVAVAEALSNEANAHTVGALLARPREQLRSAGMYSWWVDVAGAKDLAAGLGHPLAPGLIYAGQAGATRWPSGRQSTNTLWGRLVGMHLGSSAQLSTFRFTLASILQTGAGRSLDETGLTQWMTSHLSVIAIRIDDADAMNDIETGVLAVLDPPLNLAKRPPTPIRQTLGQLRRQFKLQRPRSR